MLKSKNFWKFSIVNLLRREPKSVKKEVKALLL